LATRIAPLESSDISLDNPLLNAGQVAELLAVRRSWVYEAVRSGQLPCLRVGRHIRFKRAMLEDWLAGPQL
jgi:excisionase family DNA binding protein